MKKFNAGGGIQTWTTPSGQFGFGAGPVSPISAGTQGAAAGQGLAGLFNPATIGFGLAMGALANKRAKDKLERQKNENLFLLTVDEMRKAGIDPYEMYPVELFDTSQYEDMTGLPTVGTPEEMQRETIARAVYNWRERNPEKVQEAYDDFLASGMDYADYKANIAPATPPTPPTTTPSTGPLGAVQDAVNKAASTVSGVIDDVYRAAGIPVPDHQVVTLPDGTVTIVWGDPSGTPYGKVGTSPGGTSYGVQTGVPILNDVLSRTADIISGRAKAGDVVGDIDVEDILVVAGQETLGLPDTATTKDVIGGVREVIEGPEKTTTVQFGDTTGPADQRSPIEESPPPERVPDAVDSVLDDTTTTTGTTDETPYLDLNQPTTTTDETPETPEAPAGEGATGLGYSPGVAVTTGAPGPTVDIDYLYDIYGESIFAPKVSGEAETEKRPYVYARSGGMIGDNYDLTGEIIRLLRGRN